MSGLSSFSGYTTSRRGRTIRVNPLKGDEFNYFMKKLSKNTGNWGGDCAANNESCGSLEVCLGGSGRGNTSVQEWVMGPFRD